MHHVQLRKVDLCNKYIICDEQTLFQSFEGGDGKMNSTLMATTVQQHVHAIDVQ